MLNKNNVEVYFDCAEKIIRDAIKLHGLEIEKRDVEIKQLRYENDNLKAQLNERKKENDKETVYLMECENCGNIIKEDTVNFTRDLMEYTVCDSCEATICIDCIGDYNECPVCGKEITFEENF